AQADSRLDQRRVGQDRREPACALLPHHAAGKEASGAGAGTVRTHLARHRAYFATGLIWDYEHSAAASRASAGATTWPTTSTKRCGCTSNSGRAGYGIRESPKRKQVIWRSVSLE